MKLLLDENISRRVVPALQARFPGTSQVALLGLERATDSQLCDYAEANGFVLCSKDDDFRRLVASRGYSPKLVYVALGNISNDQVVSSILAGADSIEASLKAPEVGIVVVDQA